MKTNFRFATGSVERTYKIAPARPSLTGSRIRARRLDIGLKQAALAECVDISPSYLNLIEHNRRRIGGKLLNDLANVLGVEAQVLSEGADLTLLAAMREAAEAAELSLDAADKAEELAGRFPEWAGLIASQQQKISSFERTVAALTDRLTHDPTLSSALHDLLSTVTAIRSTASILTDDASVDPEWQARFHRNIDEDSRRLATISQSLVTYLDAEDQAVGDAVGPQEQVEGWLEARNWHIEELEGADPPTSGSIAERAELPPAAKSVLAHHLRTYRQDALRVPLAALKEHEVFESDPLATAGQLGVDLATLLRRWATLPGEMVRSPVGIAISDSSGTLIFRRPLDGFPLPRFGAGCTLMPLYQSFARPMTPIRARVEQPGRTPQMFTTYAISGPGAPNAFNQTPLLHSTMLVLPTAPGGEEDANAIPVGAGCRICPRSSCVARREPSILSIEGSG